MRKIAFIVILITIPVWIGFYYIADRGIGFDPMTEQSVERSAQNEQNYQKI